MYNPLMTIKIFNIITKTSISVLYTRLHNSLFTNTIDVD